MNDDLDALPALSPAIADKMRQVDEQRDAERVETGYGPLVDAAIQPIGSRDFHRQHPDFVGEMLALYFDSERRRAEILARSKGKPPV